MKKLSLGFIDLKDGHIADPATGRNGVYLKSLIAGDDDAIAVFPTTHCVCISDGVAISAEMKLNMYKISHPDYWQQKINTETLLRSMRAERRYSVDLKCATAEVAIVDQNGIHLDNGEGYAAEDYHFFDRDHQLKADAIITDEYNVAIVAYAADCPTAFLRDKRTGAIGVLHSMWRGFVVEKNGELTSIMEAIVAKMAEHYGTNPEDLEVSIFPCIGLDEFCVGEEVVDLFVKRGLGQHVYRHENCAQPHIDLAGAMIEMFERCGVPHDSIETSPYVTANYGFNSLRMAPKNTRAFRLDDLSSYTDIAEPVHAPELHSDEENEKMIRASALNLLVAIRH